MIGLLSPITSSMGPVACICILMLICLIVTNLLDNAVTTFVFTYIIFNVSRAMGINTMGMFSILLHISSFGMLLPASAPPVTLLYGKVPDGWLGRKEILFSAIPYSIAAYVIYIAVGLATLNMY